MAEFCEVMKQIKRYCNAQSDCCRCKLYEIVGGYCPSDFIQDLIQKDQVYTIEKLIMSWAKENPEPNYPTWIQWLQSLGVVPYLSGYVAKRDDDGNYLGGHVDVNEVAHKPIPVGIAQKLGIEPKEI